MMIGLDEPDPDVSNSTPSEDVARCKWVPVNIECAGSPIVEGAIRLGMKSTVGWKLRRVRMECLLNLVGKFVGNTNKQSNNESTTNHGRATARAIAKRR